MLFLTIPNVLSANAFNEPSVRDISRRRIVLTMCLSVFRNLRWVEDKFTRYCALLDISYAAAKHPAAVLRVAIRFHVTPFLITLPP